MEPIVIFTRVRLCDKPVLKEAKIRHSFMSSRFNLKAPNTHASYLKIQNVLRR